jgi:hypothetical protein
VRLPGAPTNTDGTPNAEWWAAYRQQAGMGEVRPGAGTFKALIAEYLQSPEWQAVAIGTRVPLATMQPTAAAASASHCVRPVSTYSAKAA